jgi:hypothetical protein
MPATPFPVQALALILMGLGSGIFWSPVLSARLAAVSVARTRTSHQRRTPCA